MIPTKKLIYEKYKNIFIIVLILTLIILMGFIISERIPEWQEREQIKGALFWNDRVVSMIQNQNRIPFVVNGTEFYVEINSLCDVE